jgi:glutamyl/glutaminyl-tRNA synthetase
LSCSSKEFLEKFHITNNIAEALHSRINYYLPKSSTSPENFCVSLRKVFINDKIKTNELKRKDIKTKALIAIIESLNLNEKPKWINDKIFYEYEKKIIESSNNNLSEAELKNLYCEINDNLDLDIIETFLNDNKANEIKMNSDEDEELNCENSDIEMNINVKKTNNLNIESSLESDSDKLDILVEKDKICEDNVENYTLSVYDNIIDNIGN